MTSASLTIPMRIPSVANLREHWASRARRVKAQRRVVAAYWRSRDAFALRALAAVRPIVVRLERIAPRELDSDNSVAALKACRDQVADELGVDDRDGSGGVSWAYGQAKGPPKTHAVRITIEVQATEEVAA